MDFDLKSQQSDMEAAHKDAFTEVNAIVDNKLIKEGGIIKLSDLHEIYVARLEKTPFANPKYRSDSLKAKLVKSYNEYLKQQKPIGGHILLENWRIKMTYFHLILKKF